MPAKKKEKASPRPPRSESENKEKTVGKKKGPAKGQSASSLFFLYATLAGTCGALSGAVGKLAVASENVPMWAGLLVEYFPFLSTLCPDTERLQLFISVLLRVLSFLLNAFFTGKMWTYYLKALNLGPTPVCSIINTGTNFAVSAFVGLVLFGEEVNYMWACGALLVVIGLAVVVTDPHALQQ